MVTCNLHANSAKHPSVANSPSRRRAPHPASAKTCPDYTYPVRRVARTTRVVKRISSPPSKPCRAVPPWPPITAAHLPPEIQQPAQPSPGGISSSSSSPCRPSSYLHPTKTNSPLFLFFIHPHGGLLATAERNCVGGRKSLGKGKNRVGEQRKDSISSSEFVFFF